MDIQTIDFKLEELRKKYKEKPEMRKVIERQASILKKVRENIVSKKGFL